MSLNNKCFALPIPWSQEVNGTLRLISLCWEPFFLRLPNPSSRLKGAANQLTRYVCGRPPVTKDYWRRFSWPFFVTEFGIPSPTAPKHTQTHPFIWLKVKMTNRIGSSNQESRAMNSLMFIKLLTPPTQTKNKKKHVEFSTWNHPLIRPKTPERRMVFCNTCGRHCSSPESQGLDSPPQFTTTGCSKMWLEVPGILAKERNQDDLQNIQKKHSIQNKSIPFFRIPLIPLLLSTQ